MERSRAYAFVTVIILTGALLVRPNDVTPGLRILQPYALLALVGALFIYRQLMEQIGSTAFSINPTTVCVLGMLVAVVLSNVSCGSFRLAIADGARFCFSVLYYLLLLSVLDNENRLRRFAAWLSLILTATACISLLCFWGILSPSMSSHAGRLQAFNGVADPNYLAVLMVVAVVLTVFLTGETTDAARRLGWIFALSLQLTAFLLTASRGGLVAMVAAMGVFGSHRLGFLRTLGLIGISIPILAPRLGRMATIVDSFQHGGTGDSRLYLWQQGLAQFQTSPIWGIGSHGFKRHHPWAVHNSFLETFAELGFAGGSCFLGAFFLSGVCVWLLAASQLSRVPQSLARLQPCVAAILSGFCSGLLSLSLEYQPLTFLVLAFSAAYVRIIARGVPMPRAYQWVFVICVVAASGLFLVGTHLTVVWMEPSSLFGERR